MRPSLNFIKKGKIKAGLIFYKKVRGVRES